MLPLRPGTHLHAVGLLVLPPKLVLRIDGPTLYVASCTSYVARAVPILLNGTRRAHTAPRCCAWQLAISACDGRAAVAWAGWARWHALPAVARGGEPPQRIGLAPVATHAFRAEPRELVARRVIPTYVPTRKKGWPVQHGPHTLVRNNRPSADNRCRNGGGRGQVEHGMPCPVHAGASDCTARRGGWGSKRGCAPKWDRPKWEHA